MGRVGFVVSALGALMALGACGDDTGRTETASITAPTTASTAPTTTAEPPPELPPCTGDRYIAAPDWLPTSVPVGFEIAAANVYVEAPIEAPVDSGELFLLVDREGDLLASSIRLVRDPPEPGFDMSIPASEEPALDSVRGRPGTVARMVHRADPVGSFVASWEESGHRWNAGSRDLGPEELAAALEPLDLTTDTVLDTSDRYELIGRQSPSSSGVRTTNVVLYPADESPMWRTVQINISVDSPRDGVDGLSALPERGGEVTLSEVDGRRFAQNVSTAVTTLPDGSVARAEIRTIRPGAPRGALDADALRDTLLALAPIAPDDPALDDVVLSEGETELFCREDP